MRRPHDQHHNRVGIIQSQDNAPARSKYQHPFFGRPRHASSNRWLFGVLLLLSLLLLLWLALGKLLLALALNELLLLLPARTWMGYAERHTTFGTVVNGEAELEADLYHQHG